MASMQVPFSEQNYVISTAVSCRRTTGVIPSGIFSYAMKTLRHCFIVGHVHDELIIECSPDVDLNVICKQMGKSPDWMPAILLRADGYETNFYKKD